MNIDFYERDDNGVHNIGHITGHGTMISTDVRAFLKTLKVADGSQFDISNPEHVKQLPAMLGRGTRLFAVESPNLPIIMKKKRVV
jgi:hypothetical protein